MNRWSALGIVLICLGALAFRLGRLDTRPLHNDEAVNAFKVSELWQQGHYLYDPDEYHGPTLHYATVPFLALSGARSTNELTDTTLRLGVAVFGAALILLLFLFVDGLPAAALVWAALFTAVSPAMVFYSRYFIHEMLLVFFTALAFGAGWRYWRTKSAAWAGATGAAMGLMFATKETFVLTLAASAMGLMASAGSIARLRAAIKEVPVRHVFYAAAALFVVWFLFFSSFFTNFAGLLDSIRTYFPWLKRAAGHSPHLHPWYFYLQRLGWFHTARGPVWSEGLILLLAIAGAGASFGRNGSPLVRFIAFFTVFLTAIYSIITYKTPWCALSFLFGMILLAGSGAHYLTASSRPRFVRGLAFLLIVAGTAQLSLQAWRASYVYASDRRNPYVYAQTVPDLRKLVERIKGIAAVSPSRDETIVKVIAPDSDYWPLPWSLRAFKNVGWYDKLPDDPFAPIVVVSANLNARLDEKSEKKWIMTGITELRPGKFLELYVEFALWSKYVETLPPEPD